MYKIVKIYDDGTTNTSILYNTYNDASKAYHNRLNNAYNYCTIAMLLINHTNNNIVKYHTFKHK